MLCPARRPPDTVGGCLFPIIRSDPLPCPLSFSSANTVSEPITNSLGAPRGRPPRLPREPKVRPLDILLDPLQEARGRRAVHEAVIEGQAQEDHLPDRHAARSGIQAGGIDDHLRWPGLLALA
jgi:hypothetical protein